VFRRRRHASDEEQPDLTEVDVDDEPGADDDEGDVDEVVVSPPRTRDSGPWDSAEVDLSDDSPRLDLGALVIPGRDGLELQVQMDEESGNVVAVTVVLGPGAIQVQPFAAPRSSGIWDDVRAEIRSSINAGGGLVEEADGPFGTELRTRVPAQAPDGSQVLQAARFVGVDGPRWFLRGVFLGAGADASTAAVLEDVFRSIVVVRGGEAMAPGDPLPLTLPADAVQEDDPASGAQPPNPFERGPEITEIR
jgi:Protein of unknown function (DUF3710)